MLHTVLRDMRYREARLIARACSLFAPRHAAVAAVYYFIAVLNAVIGASSMLLLVDLVTSRATGPSATFPTQMAKRLAEWLGSSGGTGGIGTVLVGLLVLGVVTTYAFYSVDGWLEARLRQRVQERGFAAVLHGDWELLRDMRVGERVGAVTEEASNVAKYFMALVRAGYNLLALLAFLIITLTISARISILVGAVGLPVLLVIRHLFARQARLAERLVAERQGFYAGITERLNGLFQIKIEGNTTHHVRVGLRNQEALTHTEIRWWRLRAAINALNVFLPAVVIAALYVWAITSGTPVQSLLQVMAGIGVVGAQALSQANQLTANLGNLMGFAGSIPPVYALFSIEREAARPVIAERVVTVELRDVGYSYRGGPAIHGISVQIGVGKPLLLMGPSGSGKTTLANIVAGLYRPSTGSVAYVDEAGARYDGSAARPRVGYVPQDILLFQGTVRENLIGGQHLVSDAELLDALAGAGAETFVRRLGGLDAMITEAGRSLSGGERRRLGIARVLAASPDVLILDEVTVGLDEQRKAELLATIGELSQRLVVIAITHDADMVGAAQFNVVRLAA